MSWAGRARAVDASRGVPRPRQSARSRRRGIRAASGGSGRGKGQQQGEEAGEEAVGCGGGGTSKGKAGLAGEAAVCRRCRCVCQLELIQNPVPAAPLSHAGRRRCRRVCTFLVTPASVRVALASQADLAERVRRGLGSPQVNAEPPPCSRPTDNASAERSRGMWWWGGCVSHSRARGGAIAAWALLAAPVIAAACG